jgi:cysteinyl-tRNA synthetase
MPALAKGSFSLKVYNTLSGQKEEFRPQGDPVRMYVCGVTPYDACHFGHAMSYIIFDVIRRYLEYQGYRVRHVQNFTDIDDKIIARARERSISPLELAEGYIDSYFEDMDKLNIKRAHVYPRATGEIDQIITMVKGLVEKGYAYAAGGDVYFRVQGFPEYGKLSRRSLEGMMAGARIEAGEGKEHPLDFALWKGAKHGEPSWDSPWGPGRPGWHIECSAMSIRHLGETLDIHGGGQDLVFPHHENEIAQSEAFTGRAPFVRYWLHNGFVRLGAEKMSKSLGNLILAGEAIDRFGADAIRLFVLSSHYRSPLTYTEEGLAGAQRGVDRLIQAFRPGDQGRGETMEAAPYREQFIEAMDDDFNTAQAVGVLFALARDINRAREQGTPVGQAQEVLQELAGVLGLTLREEERPLAPGPFMQLFTEVHERLNREAPHLATEVSGAVEPDMDATRLIASLIGVRNGLKAQRQWALADWLRGRLGEAGVVLEDTPQGTVWRAKK